MTHWTTDPEGGRARGPRGLVRAWVEVLIRPRRFFANGTSPGDQAPALTFAAVVAAAYAIGWIVADPGVVPPVAESVVLSAVVVVLVVAALAAPVGLHLTAAVATVSMIVASVERDGDGDGDGGRGWGLTTRDRAGVSETVQVVAYASAPMALAGPPIPELRLVCGAYATVLLCLGVWTVHGTTPIRTLVGGLPPALFGYGVGYRVVAAARTLFGG